MSKNHYCNELKHFLIEIRHDVVISLEALSTRFSVTMETSRDVSGET